MKVVVSSTKQADQQALEADAWWQANRSAAPNLFWEELKAAIAMLSDAPDIGRPYRYRPVPGVRRLLMPRSRYHVYYVHRQEAQVVVVLSVWSAVRGRRPPLVSPNI